MYKMLTTNSCMFRASMYVPGNRVCVWTRKVPET